jgi:hypothetical protein
MPLEEKTSGGAQKMCPNVVAGDGQKVIIEVLGANQDSGVECEVTVKK